MQPYATPYYFIILGAALIPLVIAHLLGKKWMPYQVILTIAFLWLTFGGQMSAFALIGFGVFETILIKLYEAYRKSGKNSTLIFVLAVLLSIAPLASVKITPFVDGGTAASILGFLGISYVTFKTVNVILEIRDGLIKDVPIKDFLYFLYFFPTISSGPIDRFRRFQKELKAPITEKYQELLSKGIFRIFLGFLYNFIIGYKIDDLVLHRVAVMATLHPSARLMVISAYAYGLYLFFNFAGYSLFAIGVSNLMGYDMPINFNLPFASKNIKDFWNRWHMTLSFWFRDFVYMRLVKTILTKRLSKNMVLVSNVSYLALFGLMGVWHGLTWYYIAYGIYHALLMIAYDAWLRLKKKKKWKIPDNHLTRGVSIFITWQFVFLGFLIFSGIPNYAIMHYYHLSPVLPNF